jgi:hypothetical protein
MCLSIPVFVFTTSSPNEFHAKGVLHFTGNERFVTRFFQGY